MALASWRRVLWGEDPISGHASKRERERGEAGHRKRGEVFHRHPANPILTAADAPCDAAAVFNPGVAEVDGEVLLLVRIENRQGISHLHVARGANGVDDWRWDPQPLLTPDGDPYEEWGCEDPRITRIGERQWVIAYTAVSRYGPAIALATTRDFHSVERLGVVMSPSNKDAIVIPDLFDHEWMMLHRPLTGSAEHIWHACSNDLIHWGRPGVLIPERSGVWWDGVRIGAGAPPIRTRDGLLLIYHGVKEVTGHPIYRLGLALLDGINHRRVRARTASWVFSPEAPYERNGDAPNVVFTCGAIPRGDEVWMYYGAADCAIGLAIASMDDLLDTVHRDNDLVSV